MPIVRGRYREPDEESQIAAAAPTELHEVLHAASATFWDFRILKVSARHGETVLRLPLIPEELQGNFRRQPATTIRQVKGLIAATIAPYMYPPGQVSLGEGDAQNLVPWFEGWDALRPLAGQSKPAWEGLGASARRMTTLWLARPQATYALTTLAALLYVERQWNPAQWHRHWNTALCRPLHPTDRDRDYRARSWA